MAKKARRGCLVVLVWVLISVLAIEGLLRLFDPWGAIKYYDDLTRQIATYVPAAQGYTMPPGVYQFAGWSATISTDATRLLPDAHGGACNLVFVGDSVAFGFGVNDADTFVNRLAAQMNAHVSNRAMTGYNSDNVRRSVALFPADGYIYIVIDNDAVATIDYPNGQPAHLNSTLEGHSALQVYLDVMNKVSTDISTDDKRFAADIGALAGRSDLLMVVFAAPFADRVQALAPDALILPAWTHSISHTDPHPSAAGHAEIAAALLPVVKAFEAQICP